LGAARKDAGRPDETLGQQELYSHQVDKGDDAPIRDPYLAPLPDRALDTSGSIDPAVAQSHPEPALALPLPSPVSAYEAAVRLLVENAPPPVAYTNALRMELSAAGSVTHLPGTPTLPPNPLFLSANAPLAPMLHPALPPYQPVPSSPYATWALIVGVLGLVCFGTGPILGIVAMVLAVLGWRQVHRAGGSMRGRMTAAAGFAIGVIAIAFFVGEVALYLSLVRPARIAATAAAPKDTSDPAATVPPVSDDQSPGNGSSEPVPTTSTVSTVGDITVVDVALGVASLPTELRQQHTEASAHGERLVLQTTTTACAPCQGVASSLSDPRMQSALDHVRLVRVDSSSFEEDLDELQIPVHPTPGFFLLDSDLKVTDGINKGEWEDDVAVNMAPVLGPFVRGNYPKRRSPWKKLPRPGGTVL
jgi:hypothetical protein